MLVCPNIPALLFVVAFCMRPTGTYRNCEALVDCKQVRLVVEYSTATRLLDALDDFRGCGPNNSLSLGFVLAITITRRLLITDELKGSVY
jgi:hypothetical protein